MTKRLNKSTLAKNIIERRSRRKWSAMKLAEEAGIPYSTLRQIEADLSHGRQATLSAIAKALDCTVDDLRVEIGRSSPGIEEMAQVIVRLKMEIEEHKNKITELQSQAPAPKFLNLPRALIKKLETATSDEIERVMAVLNIDDAKLNVRTLKR